MPEQDNFEDLRRLLAVKRHEQPPPGYFDRLSITIMTRIRDGAAESRLSFRQRLFAEAPWLQQLWATFEHRPIFAGACSFAACGLVAAAVMYSDVPTVPTIGMGDGSSIAEAAPWLSHGDRSPSAKTVFAGFTNSNVAPAAGGLRGDSLFDEVRTTPQFPAHSQAVNWKK